MMLKLISATPSPYARKMRITLAESTIPFELMTEVLWDSTTATPHYNPLGKLPVLMLVLPDGSGVYESRFILKWIEAKHLGLPMLPQDTDARLFARQVEVVADGVCDALVLFWERPQPGGDAKRRVAGLAAAKGGRRHGGPGWLGRDQRLHGWRPVRLGRRRRRYRLPLPGRPFPRLPLVQPVPRTVRLQRHPRAPAVPSRAASPCRRPSATRSSEPCAAGRPTPD